VKKKFLSIFVALSLVATMFSTTLAFAEEKPSITNFKITCISETQAVVEFESSKAGALTLRYYDSSGQLFMWSNDVSIVAGSNTCIVDPCGAAYISYLLNYNEERGDYFSVSSFDDSAKMDISDIWASSSIGDKGQFYYDNQLEKDEFSLGFRSNVSGKVSFEWFLEGEAIGNKIESFTRAPQLQRIEWSDLYRLTLDNLPRADSISVTITDLAGNIAYQKTFPFVVFKNLEVKRTGLNEVEITFVSNYEGEFYVGLDYSYYGSKGMSVGPNPFTKGVNKIISPIAADPTIESGYFSSIYDDGVFSGPRFPEGQEGPLELSLFFDGREEGHCSQSITVPAFSPTEETPGVILPSTPDSDKFTWTGEGEASFRLDADPKTFVKLYVGDKKNGKEIDESNYTITAGSTIITLKEDYVKTLENGTYLYTAEFEGGDAALKLIVDTESDGKKSLIPKSGDANRAAGIVILIASLALAGASFRALRKEQAKA